jgi:hypothetical protein
MGLEKFARDCLERQYIPDAAKKILLSKHSGKLIAYATAGGQALFRRYGQLGSKECYKNG